MKSLKATEYKIQQFQRSNQDTCLLQRPSVFEGEWVQSGDLLADCSASRGGELSLGQNILIAYLPWEGYNYEDATKIMCLGGFDAAVCAIQMQLCVLKSPNARAGTFAVPVLRDNRS